MILFPVTAYATDNGDSSSVSITVVIPQTEQKKEEPPPEPEPVEKKPVRYLYPANMKEIQDDNGRREIIKTYELAANENPDNISREPFTRDCWLYEIADITKKENVVTEQKNHTEIVTKDSETKDFNEILKLLPNTKEYTSGGFTGVLTLNVSSITVEQAGAKSVAYTITETREYPHFSSNDTSLVPKTISDKYGRTLTLSNIQWKTQNTVTIDYSQLPDAYTAIATYTGTGYKTVVTGYITTAEYSGTVSKSKTGKTIYTAYFTGIPIVTIIETEMPPQTVEPETEDITETVETTTEPEPETTEVFAEPHYIIIIEPETTTEIPVFLSDTEPTEETSPKSAPYNLILIIILILETAGFGGFAVYKFVNNKKKVNGGTITE
jgi:hypothetical protein